VLKALVWLWLNVMLLLSLLMRCVKHSGVIEARVPPPPPLNIETHSLLLLTLTAMCIGGKDKENERKQRLLNIFGDWTDMVTDLIRYATA